MNPSDSLYELLPVVHRQRDAQQGYPLRALLRVLGEQADVVERDIAQLYANWFIETCEDWVVPYLGDLIGYRPVPEAGKPGDPRTAQGRALNRFLVPRREVANTLYYRRRKGTLALLELLARDVAGWPARAVEFYRLLAWSQHVNHVRLERARTANLRRVDALDRLDGPFDELAHSVDVRRINSRHSRGRFNIPSVGLYVWRLRPYSVTQAPAYCLERQDHACFNFSVLGNDAPLFTRPEPEPGPTHIAGELNVPEPIRRHALWRDLKSASRAEDPREVSAYYGPAKSLMIWVRDPQSGDLQAVPANRVVAADLTGWDYQPKGRQVAVDPVLGRIAFAPRAAPRGGVVVRYHYGFSADLGGGEYERTLTHPSGAKLYRVGPGQGHYDTIQEALNAWKAEKVLLAAPGDERQPIRLAAVVEIADSGVYTERLELELDAHESLQLRAANRTRPVLRLLDYSPGSRDSFRVSGGPGSRFTLDGLLVAGRPIQISGPPLPQSCEPTVPTPDLCSVTIRHCTLVPGWTLDCECGPQSPAEASLILDRTSAKVRIEHSILGAVRVIANAVATEPLRLWVSDSIWDATSEDLLALSGEDETLAHAALSIARSTVLGGVSTHELTLGENSIFLGHVCVARRQRGCVRFCYVPPGSRTPRRFECQPDLVEEPIREKARSFEIDPTEEAPALDRERLRVRPRFNSVRYGWPDYCQLADDCAVEIRRGADDESEMGAFHDLFQPQREAALRVRLDEYIPAGCDAGILYANYEPSPNRPRSHHEKRSEPKYV